MNTKFSRQTDLIKPEELTTPIRIIGAGGIGSWTTLALAKMGCSNLTVQDFDRVDEVNTASQIYSKSDIDMAKCEALGDIVQQLTDVGIIWDLDKWIPNHKIKEPIVILAIDNLQTRKEIFEDLKKNTKVRLLIDGRMSGDYLRVFFVPLNNNYAEYESTFVPPEQVDPEPCTGKAVVYNVFMVASIIANMVKQYQKKQMTDYKEFSFDFSNLQQL